MVPTPPSPPSLLSSCQSGPRITRTPGKIIFVSCPEIVRIEESRTLVNFPRFKRTVKTYHHLACASLASSFAASASSAPPTEAAAALPHDGGWAGRLWRLRRREQRRRDGPDHGPDGDGHYENADRDVLHGIYLSDRLSDFSHWVLRQIEADKGHSVFLAGPAPRIGETDVPHPSTSHTT